MLYKWHVIFLYKDCMTNSILNLGPEKKYFFSWRTDDCFYKIFKIIYATFFNFEEEFANTVQGYNLLKNLKCKCLCCQDTYAFIIDQMKMELNFTHRN